jgi:hypothetical protein
MGGCSSIEELMFATIFLCSWSTKNWERMIEGRRMGSLHIAFEEKKHAFFFLTLPC